MAMAASTVGNPFVPRGDAGEARAAVQARLAHVRQRLAEEVESDRDAHANRVTFGHYYDDDDINDAHPSSMYANGNDDDDAFYANLPYGGGGGGGDDDGGGGGGGGDGEGDADVLGDDANRGYRGGGDGDEGGGGGGGGGGGEGIDFNGTQRTPMGRSRGQRWGSGGGRPIHTTTKS